MCLTHFQKKKVKPGRDFKKMKGGEGVHLGVQRSNSKNWEVSLDSMLQQGPDFLGKTKNLQCDKGIFQDCFVPQSVEDV